MKRLVRLLIGAFVGGVSLRNLNVLGCDNKRSKFEDIMRLAQWLMNEAELEMLMNKDTLDVDVAHKGNVIKERVMRHVAAFEKQKVWNSTRLRASYTGIADRLTKLKAKGIDFYSTDEERTTPPGNTSIR